MQQNEVIWIFELPNISWIFLDLAPGKGTILRDIIYC